MKKLMLLFLLTFLVSCSSSDDSPNPGPEDKPVLSRLEISSSNGNQLDLGGVSTTSLTVTGYDQFNNPIAISSAITWSSNNGNITVNQNGTVTANSVGGSIVTASVNTISNTFNIIVVDTTPQTGTFIYVSDAGNFDSPPWKILRYNENGNNPEVFINTNLGWPQDILFMEAENVVLISNLNTGLINRHNATTGAFINSFATGIGGPTRIKIGPDNLLYVLQWSGNGKVLRYNLNGTFVDEFTDVGVSQSIGMDWDSSGNLYVSSFGNKLIRKFDTSGNNLGIFVNTNLQGPTNIWFDSMGNLLVNDWSGGRVAKFDASGNFINNPIVGLNQPEGIEFFPDGSFMIGNGGTGAVKLYNNAGNYVEDIVSSNLGGLIRPNAVVIRVIN